MARKRKIDDSGGASWLETYSDLVTLLLTFFILMYSISTVDAQKYAKIAEAFSKGNVIISKDQLGAGAEIEGFTKDVPVEAIEKPEDIDQLYKLITEYVEENNLSESVDISKSEEYVFIRFSNNIIIN